MTSHKNITYAVALAGALTLGLAGCTGGGEDPTATPQPTASSSSTASASPSVSGSPSGSASSTGSTKPSPSVSVSVPTAARAHTEAGAIAFARWIIDQADAAYVGVDASVFDALGDEKCEGCASVKKDVKDLRATEYHQKGRALTVTEALVVSQAQAETTVDLLVTSKAVPFVHKSGVEKGGTKAEKRKLRLIARWANDGWRVANFAGAK